MSAAPVPPTRVPTLTEVVAWPATQAPEPAGVASATDESAAGATPAAPSSPTAPAPPMAAALPPGVSEEMLTQRVLAELQRQVDLVLEYRLREVLAPLLARAADGVVRDARGEVASTLRDLVTRAVESELARHRGR